MSTMPPLSVAPMMDRTDRHMRRVMRAITRHTLLYTEMVTQGAVLHGDRERLLGYDPTEHRIALQLGGDDPAKLAECARIAEDMGYDEVNLNVGCPSDRVQQGCFGVVLMRTPEKVARAVEAMQAVVSVPVTVKHRIGVDDLDRYEDMLHFVDVVAAAGCTRFTVHARKAWLKGLSPKENRNVPPLRYHDVYRLKRERPELQIEINGGITTMDETAEHLEHVDAVMIGRAACDAPYRFAEADRRFFDPAARVPTRREVVEEVAEQLAAWQGRPYFKAHHITRHVLNLFAGEPGTKMWKRTLAQAEPTSGPEVLFAAWEAVMAARQRLQDRRAS